MAQALFSEQKTKTAVAYMRVSTDHQTTDNQRLELSKYAEIHKVQIIDFYQDEAISGTVPPFERPGFGAMMDYIKSNKVDHVLIFDLTRIGRTFWDTMIAVREIERYSKIVSSREPYLQIGHESMKQIQYSILSWAAEREREMLIDRIKAGMARAAAQGIKAGRRERRLSEQEIQLVIDYLKTAKEPKQKQRMQDAAALIDISYPILYKKLAQAGYIDMSMITKIDADKMLDLIDAGAGQIAIGKALGVSQDDIIYAMHRLNIYGQVRYLPGRVPARPYCIVKNRPNMTIIRYRKHAKLRLPA